MCGSEACMTGLWAGGAVGPPPCDRGQDGGHMSGLFCVTGVWAVRAVGLPVC